MIAELGGRLGDVILPLTTGQHHHHQAMPGVNRVDASGQQRLVELGRLGDVILPLTTGQHHHHQAMPGVNRVDASGQQRLVELFWQDRFLPGLATAASGSPRPDKKLPMLHTPAAALAGNGFSLLGSSNPGVNSTCSSSTIGEAAKQAMSKVGNQTNSQDPQAVNSRVFVGNLNTFQVTKTEIEKMFQPYGRIADQWLS
ncbi:unnamed protein product [Notodromas monacha]|uniref:RRM domain-containing protein n=1 Tax=Notodromas monacha TaxID=399045 RepID=A0A7R9BIR5_9CRUS|nr:unnamed protein product [Notodromas monacha]CAG0916279.1 unnamed protein product [Notodromas monacha]